MTEQTRTQKIIEIVKARSGEVTLIGVCEALGAAKGDARRHTRQSIVRLINREVIKRSANDALIFVSEDVRSDAHGRLDQQLNNSTAVLAVGPGYNVPRGNSESKPAGHPERSREFYARLHPRVSSIFHLAAVVAGKARPV